MASSTAIVSVGPVDQKWLTNVVLIVGAGPAGLATAACLHSRRVPFVILEREDCVGSLWKQKTYDRLHLHLPKRFCELPLFPFPETYPTYPTRDQFVSYLDEYASRFDIKPVFNTNVKSAEFSSALGLWTVTTEQDKDNVESLQYMARWLVVATGENGTPIMPDLPGQGEYSGTIMHGSMYRNGRNYENKNVLVVGCGNTGMEVALDLANFKAKPTLVVRSPFHVMPRELFGLHISTFQVSMKLMDIFPLWIADKCIIFLSWLTLGSTAKYGIHRPKEGPMAMKAKTGQTPVLDVGTIAKVKSGQIKVVPQIERLTKSGAKFVNGVEDDFDVIVMATGYTSTVPQWLKDDRMFGNNGFPKLPYPNGWKSDQRLYAVGFGRKGLLGCAHDAMLVAEDIEKDNVLDNPV